MIRLILLCTLLLAACSSDTVREDKKNVVTKDTAAANIFGKADTTYVSTGFYYVVDDQDGRTYTMRKDKSTELCTISRVPFAGVKNITKTKLERTPGKNGDLVELCMTFDPEGTKNLMEGTGNPAHPKIAAVVANKLLFVVDNKVSIKTGVMCVALVGFSEQEMKEMQHAVHLKK